MVAYIPQSKNPDNEFLDGDCPWVSWVHNEGDPLPDNAILLTDEEWSTFYALWEPKIMIAKDKITMQKRAEMKDHIVGEIAAKNKQRIREGVWTVPQLVGLTQDPQFIAVLNDITSLSFELAQSKVMAMTNPLITPTIKMEIVGKLQENLFL
jgi:hypothetical protein